LPYPYVLHLIVAGGQSQATMEDFSSQLLEVLHYLSPNLKMVCAVFHLLGLEKSPYYSLQVWTMSK
jgi:hypothetical protein